MGPEAVERVVEFGRAVHDLAVRGAHACRGHHVLGERLGPLDPGGGGRRAEAGDASGAHRVGDPEHKRHLGTDHHEVGVHLGGQRDHVFGGGRVHRADLRVLGDPHVAGGGEQRAHRGIPAQGQDEGMFTGSGTDDEYTHGNRLVGAAGHALSAAPCRAERRLRPPQNRPSRTQSNGRQRGDAAGSTIPSLPLPLDNWDHVALTSGDD